MSVEPYLAEAGEIAPNGARVYWCRDHGMTIGAWHCVGKGCPLSAVSSFDPASGVVVGFGDATAAQIGTQELNR